MFSHIKVNYGLSKQEYKELLKKAKQYLLGGNK